MKEFSSNTKLLFLFGIFCYVVMLSFTPLLHVTCYEDLSCHDHENEHSEQPHSEEGCAACVLINIHIQVGIQPKAIVSPTFCHKTLPLKEASIWTPSPLTTIQSRAPPVFSNSI